LEKKWVVEKVTAAVNNNAVANNKSVAINKLNALAQ
jgi:hypothetical protein